MNPKAILDQLIETVIAEGASDLHLSEDRLPIIRASGFLVPLVRAKKFTKSEIEAVVEEMLTANDKKEFEEKKDIDFAYSHESARFRGNAFYSLGKICVALRLIPKRIRSLEELNLPPILEMFAKKQQGFFLCVGPASQGKSTTLATLLDMINSARMDHIVTIEDPVEYVFESKKAIIDQREVALDTADFHTALRNVFRQDVDVVMVGEMRDPETISTAVTAAETGHLGFSTLPTNTA